MGNFTATVVVTANGTTNSQTFTITVPCEEPPTAQPTLVQPSDMTVCVGETAEQQLSVLNAEGIEVTFLKVSGPDFMTVSSTGVVHLMPVAGDEAGSPYTVSVSAAGETKTFTIHVHAAM